jgi:phage/conjugal plasmid C-4 type zinc finger TraR family protein
MRASNAMIEQAEARVEAERDAAVARIRSQLRPVRPSEPGPFVCDCGEPIPEARRRAYPNARDCIDCATFRQRKRA